MQNIRGVQRVIKVNKLAVFLKINFQYSNYKPNTYVLRT